MTPKDIKNNINNSLATFQAGNLTKNALDFFATLGYNTSRTGHLPTPQYPYLKEILQNSDSFEEASFEKNALTAEWSYVDVLFQLSEKEMTENSSLFDAQKKVDNTQICSYLFMAIELQGSHYTRTQLTQITRAVNRCYAMPVLMVFKYGQYLTLSIINRRINQKDDTKDVVSKVTLIKDIVIKNPHRAHIEILADLALTTLKTRHNITNFIELHKAWQKTLDTNELNKRFFQELSNWYFWAVQTVEYPNDSDPNETREARNAKNVIRLLTRLIFTWFLKEKDELVPEEFFNKNKLDDILNYKDKTGSTYYKAILQNLFFASLNTEMPKDNFAKHTRQFVARQSGIDGYLRYKRFFKDEQKALDFFQYIPFLNGGLFENLDKTENNKKTEIRIDCFSNRIDNEHRLSVPDFLFFDEKEETEVDLNAAYGTKDKVYKVRPLIALLNRYKFTITENTPIEEEIALDPELLGRVFENLLASFNPETKTTARKLTGSFYTPREVVDYMVSQSLKTYFLQHLLDFQQQGLQKLTPSVIAPQIDIFGKTPPQQAYLPMFDSQLSEAALNDIDKKLDDLLSYNDAKHGFSPSEVDVLMRAIDQLKILDPACGSGAFPMGILQKLVLILQKLDKDNKTWRSIQVQRAQEDTQKTFQLDNAEDRIKRLQEINEIFDLNASDYGRKLFLIENHIFGVDIQPIAVQISKLRFFISLIVEQRIDRNKPNYGIRPLPNLETKFVAADTLIGLPSQLDIFANSSHIESLKKELGLIREKHFFARTPQTKEKYRHKDAATRQQIRAILQQNIDDYFNSLKADIHNNLLPLLAQNEAAKNTLEKDIEAKKKAKAPENVIRPLQTKCKKLADAIGTLKQKINDRKALIAQKTEHEANADAVASWNPYDQNQAAKFFHLEWMFSMPHTEGGGFDVVIGNPPYVQIQKLGREKQLQFEQQRFQTYDRTGDIYELFYERGFKLLKSNGVLCYITSNKWMRANYGKSTRRFLSQQTKPLQIIDFGNVQIFESATVDTNILVTQNTKTARTAQACRVDKVNWDETTTLAQYVVQNNYPLSNLSENEWIIGEKDIFDIKGRVVAQGTPLNHKNTWDIQINRGILTGLNEAFIIDEVTKQNLIEQDPTSEEIIKPILRGRDIQKFYPDLSNRNWLINTHNGVKALEIEPIDAENDYPAIYNHLQQYKEPLQKRQDKGDKWTNLRNCAYIYDFEKPKIIYPNMTKYLPFVYDEKESFFINDKGFIMTGKNLKYLTAVFNSKLFKYCFIDNFPELQGGTRELRKVFFEKLPIKYILSEEQQPFERLVEYIIYLKQQTLDTLQARLMPTYFEQILDGLVYELYFKTTFEKANLYIHKHLLELPKLDTHALNDPSVSADITAVFQQLYDRKHPVRNAVFQMMAIQEVKLIHDTVQHLDKNMLSGDEGDAED